jgi:DNA-directed RNA polymerase specialized sigma24 family protein
MGVDGQVLRRARKGNLRAAIQVISECYPCAHRMAHGLTGRDDVGRGVVQYILRRGLRVLEKWDDEGEPMRWCQHHTVLATRRAGRHQPDVASDTLVRGARTDNAYYAAFIRALRALPVQQREAFILHHGERLDNRGLAVAMDCSTEAAGNHLREASKALSALGGDYFPAFTAQLAQTYQSLTPSEELVLTNVQWKVRRHLWPRKAWRAFRTLVLIGLLVAIAWFFWRIYPKLVF